MDMVKQVLTFLTFFICCACMAFLAASLATHEWLIARPVRIGMINDTHSNASTTNAEDDGNVKKFHGEVNFGLFEGRKVLNFGYGPRSTHIHIKVDMARNPQFMVFGLWLFTVLSVSLGLLFGLVSAIFAIINTVTTPVETITGTFGLYLWNSFGALFSLSAAVSWIVQYYLKLLRNVMSKEDAASMWVSDGRAWFGFSFWFTVVAVGLFALNIVILLLANQQPWEHRKPKAASDKNPEGVIMLY